MNQMNQCEGILDWLASNLGPECLGGLTGTDTRALFAAVQIIELFAYDRYPSNLAAFGSVVRLMQTKNLYLAYHAIAKVMDWSDRQKIWASTSLDRNSHWPVCSFEPGGRHVDLNPKEEAA
jgi:hypothetical protein